MKYSEEQIKAAADLLRQADEIEKMPDLGRSLAIMQAALAMIPTPELRVAVVNYAHACEVCANMGMTYDNVEEAARLLQ